MVVVELSSEHALELIQEYGPDVSLAASNSPRLTVLSGESVIIDHIMQDLAQRHIFCRRVKVDVASHSSRMDPLLHDLLLTLGDIHPVKAKIPMYSTVLGSTIVGTELDAEYWLKNLREPVLFSESIQLLIKEERTHFLELSPHPVLVSSLEEGLRFAKKEGRVWASLRRGEHEKEALLRTLATLYTCGYLPAWQNLYISAGRYHVLPCYPWQRERFWVEKHAEQLNKQVRPLQQETLFPHPLLGQHIASALSPTTHYWERNLGVDDLIYLQDHQIHEQVIVAGAVFLEMALASSRKLFS